MNRVYTIFFIIVAIIALNNCINAQISTGGHAPGEFALFDFDSQSAFDGWNVRDLTHIRSVGSDQLDC